MKLMIGLLLPFAVCAMTRVALSIEWDVDRGGTRPFLLARLTALDLSGAAPEAGGTARDNHH